VTLFALALLFQIEIASPAPQGAAEPFLFATRDSVLLSWLEPAAASRFALRFARHRDGRWSAARTIVERDDLFVNWADFPSIAEDANGVLYAHWLQKSGSSTYAYDVWMSTSSDDGVTWRAPFLVNRDGTKTEHGFVTLAPLPRGGVGVTWLDGRNMPEGKEEGEMTIRYATVDASGKVAADTQLDRRTCECCTTAMAVTKSGPVIAYRDRNADEVRDISIVRKSASGWTAPKAVHADGWKIDGCPVNGPQLDAIGQRVAAAWFTAAQDRGRAYVAFSSDGGATFDKPVQIDEGKPAGRVDLVMLDRADRERRRDPRASRARHIRDVRSEDRRLDHRASRWLPAHRPPRPRCLFRVDGAKRDLEEDSRGEEEVGAGAAVVPQPLSSRA
jgi:hypothetical protein